MNKSLIAAAVLAMTLTLLSCSSSTSTNTPTATVTNYMPLKAGNYWIYKRAIIDTTGSTSSTTVSDSSFVLDSISYQGRSAFRVEYDRAEGTKDTTYFHKESDESIYTYINTKVAILDTLAPGFNAPSSWVLIRPGNDATSWVSLDTTFNGVTLDLSRFGMDTVTASLNFKINGTLGAKKSASVNGSTYDAQEYIQNFVVSVNAGAVSYTMTQHYLFIKDVGMYILQADNSSVLSPFGTLMKVPGSVSTLTRFSVH